MQTQAIRKETAAGFWQYVKQEGETTCEIDRDRAMEYLRKNSADVKTFKLVLLGATIAFNQVRKTDRDVLGFYADFVLDSKYPVQEQPVRAVTIRAEIRKEDVSLKTKDRSSFYEFTLLVSIDTGKIVDVDYSKLQRQLYRERQPMRGY